MIRSVYEAAPPGKSLGKSNNQDLPIAPIPDKVPVKCAYMIGMREDGTLIFEIIGTSPGLVELLGLHTLAMDQLQEKIKQQLGE